MLCRTDTQRGVDALMSLMIDGSATTEGAQLPEPLMHFGIDQQTFTEHLADMLAQDLPADTSAGTGEASLFDDWDWPDDDSHNAPEPGTSDKEASHGDPSSDAGNLAPNTDTVTADEAGDTDDPAPPKEPLVLPPPLPDTSAAFDPNRKCETGKGWPVPFRVMIEQVLNCRIRRVVFAAPSVIIDAGHSRRLFSPVQRELTNQRDRCCTFPGCHRNAIYCETDHILAVVDGGPTNLSNGQCLCRHHHQLKTRGAFYCERMPNGEIRFYLPTGIQIE